MNSNRILELLFVFALIAVGYKAMTVKETSAVKSPAATVQQDSIPNSQPVEFTLPRVGGEDYEFKADGRNWTLITLTAIGCGGCIERQPTDAKAYGYMKDRGGRTVSLYLYGSPAQFESVLKENPTQADAVLADYQGKIGVSQLRGSDSRCWILLRPDGVVAWQGGAQIEALKNHFEVH